MMGKLSATLLAGIAAAFIAGAAHADVVISGKATANMSCSAGVCSPTASKAVLNVTDLANMLAAGDVKVTTGAGATNIVVKDSFSRTSTSRLMLDAIQSVEFDKPVTVAGTGAVTITTNDGGSGGDLLFGDKGNLTFWDTGSSLIINGSNYTLVSDIKTLAADIAANPSGFYALANDYDASVDGTYTQAPIPSSAFSGTVEGLGNAIIHLKIDYKGEADDPELGLFDALFGSIVRDLGVLQVSISTKSKYAIVGALTGLAYKSTIIGCYSSGSIIGTGEDFIGGLVGQENGEIGHRSMIVRSHSSATVTGYDQAYGGLVGSSSRHALISESYATGNITGGADAEAGGLVGAPSGRISNSYALGAVTVGGWDHQSTNPPAAGGLAGREFGHLVEQSYSIGAPRGEESADVGGMVGVGGRKFPYSYWDIDTSGQDKSAGGIGLSDAQLKAGLPEGFDPKIWGQNPSINNGYPYLLANPPPH